MDNNDTNLSDHSDFIDYFRYCYRNGGVSDHLLTIVHSLYEDRNYSFRDISEFLGVTKTTVSKWMEKDFIPTRLPATIPNPKPKNYQLSELEKQNLENLAKMASKVSRFTPQDAPSRRAAQQLVVSIKGYLEKNTTITEIARAANVSRRSIYQRLEADAENNK